MSTRITTDCRTPIGMAVDLIDIIATVAGVAVRHDLTTTEAREALRDMVSDEDVVALFHAAGYRMESVS